MADTVATRFAQSFGAFLPETSAPCLLVRIYPVSGIEQPLQLSDEPLLVGRETTCSLPLSDDSVSRRHALIEPHGEGHLVADLGSTNGTYVNEQRIYDSHQLKAGDRVRFGNQIFKYLSADRIEAQYYEVIFKLMTTDGLTSAHNKHYMLETLEREWHQSRRAGSPLCVMMLDLDKFKGVNDRYGHLAGDAVLVEFARRAKSVLRSGDLFARYGGEEFAMVLTRTAIDDAVMVAERIRELTAATPFTFENQSIPVTVSIGIGYDMSSPNRDSRDLLAEADQQLYFAKRTGRDQVCHQRDLVASN